MHCTTRKSPPHPSISSLYLGRIGRFRAERESAVGCSKLRRKDEGPPEKQCSFVRRRYRELHDPLKRVLFKSCDSLKHHIQIQGWRRGLCPYRAVAPWGIIIGLEKVNSYQMSTTLCNPSVSPHWQRMGYYKTLTSKNQTTYCREPWTTNLGLHSERPVTQNGPVIRLRYKTKATNLNASTDADGRRRRRLTGVCIGVHVVWWWKHVLLLAHSGKGC